MMATHKLSSTPGSTLVPLLLALLALTGAAAQAAVSVDFRQDANNDSGFNLGEAHWINSIVQSSNAVYFEGMGLAQRVILKDLPGTNADGTKHSLTFGHQWTKGGTHAFDWLMSWEQAEATGTGELHAYMNVGPQLILTYRNGIEIAASMLPVSTNLTPLLSGPKVYDVPVPADPYISKDGAVSKLYGDFEAAYGPRTIRLFSDAEIDTSLANKPVLTMTHSVANGADTGDSFVSYTLTWQTKTKSTQAVIWMAAHIAVGNNAATLIKLVPGGWGMYKGASQINGGPYHFTLDRADNARLGNQDNQLKGSSVRALPECNLAGPGEVCPYSSDNVYTITSDDPAATFQWYFDGDPQGASFVGDTTGSTVQVQAGACGTAFRLCVTVTDSTDLSNSCCADVSVDDTENPTASNPDPVSVQCAGDVSDPDVTVVDDEADNCGIPTVTFIGDVSDGNTCPEVITRTYRVTDSCDNYIDVTQTITVDDTMDPTASDPEPVTVQCIGDVPKPDITVVDDEKDNCTVNPTVEFVTDVSDGKTCPEIITRTYKVSDDCGNSIEVKQTITVDDNTDPTASNPTPILVQCAGDVPQPDPTVVTDEADNCTASPKVEFLSATSPEGSCPTTFTRTYRVTDDCGNFVDVVQQVTIDDTTDPTASDPAPISVECRDAVPAPDITVVTDEADNCGVPTVEFVSDVSDGKKCPETITRTYKVTDACNNSILVHQTITVDDITPPEVTCATGAYTVYLTLDDPAASDNCGVTKPPVFTRSDQLGRSDPYPVGQLTVVTISIEDDCGNVSTCTYNIDLRSLGPVTPAS